MTHDRVWRFEPAPGREAEFAAAYSGDGVWARLFGRSGEFRGTTLLHPAEPGGPWLTLDRWASHASFERFQQEHGDDYRKLDLELAGLTSGEEFIGAFADPAT